MIVHTVNSHYSVNPLSATIFQYQYNFAISNLYPVDPLIHHIFQQRIAAY